MRTEKIFDIGGNQLYLNLEPRRIKREKDIKPAERVEQTNYSRDATKETIGRNIDLII